MKTLCSIIEDHLRRHHLEYHTHTGEADCTFVSPHRGKHTGVMCMIQVYEDERRLAIIAFNGTKSPPERIAAVFEYAAHVNCCMAIGALWVAPEVGDVSFAVTASALGIEPTDIWLGSLIKTAVYTFDSHVPNLASIIYAGRTALDVLCEDSKPAPAEVEGVLSQLFDESANTHEAVDAADSAVAEEAEVVNEGPQCEDDARREQTRPPEARKSECPHSTLANIVLKVTPQDIADTLDELTRQTRTSGEKSEEDDKEVQD